MYHKYYQIFDNYLLQLSNIDNCKKKSQSNILELSSTMSAVHACVN